MKFSIDWRDGDRGSPDVDLSAVGELRIHVGGTNVCRCLGTGDRGAPLCDDFSISAYPLAEGVAMDWWRLFGGRDVWHRLRKYRGGYAIPDIRIRFDGAGFDIDCTPYRYENPPVFFTECGKERLKRADVEHALGGFLDEVVAHLDAGNTQDSGLQLRWARIRTSREDEDEVRFCEAAGALGLDPYDVSDDDAAFIEASGVLFEGEPLAEFLAGLRGADEPEAVLDWIRRSEEWPRYKSRLPVLHDVKRHVRNAAEEGSGADAERPWAPGYRCARATRRALEMSQEQRFTSVSALAKRLGAGNFGMAPSVPGIRALVRSDDRETRIHLRRTGDNRGNLFALGRAIGDAIANPPARRSAVNDLPFASRQACGRAFAAEFLAPVDEVRSMREDGLDTISIADEFGVSTEVVERQLENAERIRQACA